MVSQDSFLVTLVNLVDRVPMPVQLTKRGRGHPIVYPDRLFLKALVIMIVRHLHNVHELLSVLAQPTAEMRTLRLLLTQQEHFPSRRTWERRLQAIPATLPAQIGCLGRHLVSLIQPWATCGRAVAIDSTILRARGGVWHQKHREKGELPHTSIDPEAHWTKSGWHGWVSGWKLHVVSVVATVWFPVAAMLTPANVADSEPAPDLVREVLAEVRFVLGDLHDNTPELRENCEQDDRVLVTTRYGRYPHPVVGVEMRRVFH
jgi:Transposase DDE domain